MKNTPNDMKLTPKNMNNIMLYAQPKVELWGMHKRKISVLVHI